MAGQPNRGREAAAQRAQGGGGNVPATVDQSGSAVDVRPDPRASTVRTLFERMAPEMERSLPKHMTVDRMIRVALTVVQEDEDLLKCDPRSLLGALMTCTQVGLEPGPQGHVYFLPFWDKDARAFKVTFVTGYKGMIELARRSGLLLRISAHTVYANEVKQGLFSVEYGSSNKITHKPIVFGDRGDPVGYYGVARIASPTGRQDTEDVFVVLTRDEVDKFRQRSPAQKAERASGPWNTDYEAMAWKTCVRRMERWLPQSPELAAALAHEETVRETLSGNVLDQAEPHPAEPFDRVAATKAVGELNAPAAPVPPAGDEVPPDVDPRTGEVADRPTPGPADASQDPGATDPAVNGDPEVPGEWSNPPTPEPEGRG